MGQSRDRLCRHALCKSIGAPRRFELPKRYKAHSSAHAAIAALDFAITGI